MNFLFTSPHFPENFEPFVVRMKQKGVNVYGIGDKPYDQLSKRLKDAMDEYYLVHDMENYDEMYKAVAYLSFKHGKIDRLESHNEYWLAQDAKLRTDFNIWGLKTADMATIKYKSQMKDVFRRCRIKVADGRVFDSLEDALSLAKSLRYPVIVKPDNGVGGNNTYKIEDEAHLRQIFPRLTGEDYIMEAYLDGQIVTFDGLCDQDGQIVYRSHFVYDRNCLEVIDDHQEMFFRVDPDIPKKLEQKGRRAVKKFGLKERFFHMEFMQVGNDYYGMEINCRPPGGLCFDVLNYANDIDLFAEYANVVVDNHFYSKPENKYYTYYVSRLNDVSYRYTQQEITDKYKDYFKLVTEVPAAFSNILGDTAFIFRTTELDEAYVIVNKIIEVKS